MEIKPPVGNLFYEIESAAGTKDSQAEMLDAKRREVAKNFESILIEQMLRQMKETIPDSGLFDEPATGQIENMFWSFMGRNLAEQDGFGLWQQIYNKMVEHDGAADLSVLDESA